MIICYCVCHSFTNLVIIDYGHYRLRSYLGSDTMFFDNAKKQKDSESLTELEAL